MLLGGERNVFEDISGLRGLIVNEPEPVEFIDCIEPLLARGNQVVRNFDALVEVRVSVLHAKLGERLVVRENLDQRVGQPFGARFAFSLVELSVENLFLHVAVPDADLELCEAGVVLERLNHKQKLI
jgi:hypothetical protein